MQNKIILSNTHLSLSRSFKMASVESQVSKQSEAPLQNDNENAEQLATLAEGKVADAVKGTSSRDKPRKDDIKIEDYTSDLEKFVLIYSPFSIWKLMPC